MGAGVGSSLGGGFNGQLAALAVLPSGDLILGGDFTDLSIRPELLTWPVGRSACLNFATQEEFKVGLTRFGNALLTLDVLRVFITARDGGGIEVSVEPADGAGAEGLNCKMVKPRLRAIL